MLPALFQDEHHYRQAFAQGLQALLQENALGSFILVLANAIHDPALQKILQSSVKTRYGQLAEDLQKSLTQGRDPDHPGDDLLVFLKLMAVGLENLQSTRSRQAGPWELQHNHLRAFRPARMSGETVTALHAPFDDRAFHFNKSFLRKEIIWEGELMGHDCRLLYNKFPFAPLHGLLVIEPEERHPQYLGKFTHDYLWRLMEALGEHLPGCGFGYNARGACSSVNHQHVQLYAGKESGYPVEHSSWSHNGGAQPWPLPCQRLGDANEAWHFIEELHRQNRAYNLLYRPGHLYVISRAMQGGYTPAAWAGGFAWAETAGAIILSNARDYHALTEDQIRKELEKLRP